MGNQNSLENLNDFLFTPIREWINIGNFHFEEKKNFNLNVSKIKFRFPR